MSKFKLGLSIVFSAFIVIAVVVFATSKGVSTSGQSHITLWGFLPESSFNKFIQSSPLGTDETLTVTYVEKTKENFQNDFVNALANGVPPDVIMISQDMVLANKNKLFIIPYTNYSERTFKDLFVQEGELFLSSDGVVALPFMIDPLVMYWNRDIFNAASIPTPPKYFDEFLTLPTRLSKVDRLGNISQSAVALGGWSNIKNAKAILSNLMLSAGTQIVGYSREEYKSVLLSNNGQAETPAQSSVNFFTQFANPTSQTYSWNRSMANSLTSFLSGNLGVYFGFASELPVIREKNPNLNFDVAFMPQPRQSSKKVVFGNITGLAIVKQSQNVPAAFQAISLLTDDDTITLLESYTYLPPVKRALFGTTPTDPYKVIFYQSALYAQGWLDPSSVDTDKIFQNVIDAVASGRMKVSEALDQANKELDSLLK